VDFLGTYSQVTAFSCDSSGFVALLGYIIVVYSFLVDEYIFNLPITGLDILGTILIVVVTVTTTVYKVRMSRKM
jgi:drug/metabolite transporter (DMT)-like permease